MEYNIIFNDIKQCECTPFDFSYMSTIEQGIVGITADQKSPKWGFTGNI